MYICKLQLNDIIEHEDSICKLLMICFQSTYEKKVLDKVIIEKYAGLKKYIQAGNAYTFGAIEDNSLIGFLWGYPVITPIETVFHVAYISVLESGRRLGIGVKLIEAAEKECRDLGLGRVELIVGAENRVALDFYNHCGYKPDRYYLRKDVK